MKLSRIFRASIVVLGVLTASSGFAAAADSATTIYRDEFGIPHIFAPTLEDAAYAVVVKAIDAAIAADGHARTLVVTGLERLGDDFAARPEAARTEALKAVEASEFFGLVRAQTLINLYSSQIAYAHFGYEGEAFSKGGYLTRGFNELDWLPDVPPEDSGPDPSRAAR